MLEDLAALASCSAFVSRDVDETRARMSSLLQPHMFTPSGRSTDYRVQVNFFNFSAIGVAGIRYSQPIHLRLDYVTDYHLLILCRRGTAKLRIAGRELIVGPGQGACVNPGEPLDSRFSGDFEQLVFKVDAGALRRHAGFGRPRLRSEIDLADRRFRPWVRLVHGILDDTETAAFASSRVSVASEYEALFLSTFLHGSLVREETCSSEIASSAVRRAEAFIAENFADPISLADIAAAAGVPARTLLNGFRRFRDTSPVRALRDRRLEAARAQLSASAGGETVMSIALDVGFGHPGRFAIDYAERFGERPSETLRRGARRSHFRR